MSKKDVEQDAEISFDDTKTEITISKGNVELVYSRKEPEISNIYISRTNLPDVRIPFSDWEVVDSVLSGWRSVRGWMKAQEAINQE